MKEKEKKYITILIIVLVIIALILAITKVNYTQLSNEITSVTNSVKKVNDTLNVKNNDMEQVVRDRTHTINESTKRVEKEVNRSRSRVELEDELSGRVLKLNFNDEEITFDTSYSDEEGMIDSLCVINDIEVVPTIIGTPLPEGTLISVNGVDVTNQGNIQIPKIEFNEDIIVTLHLDNLTREYKIKTLPYDFPTMEKVGESPYEGDYYFNTMYLDGVSYIVKMSDEGNILYYKRSTDGTIGNFQKVTVGNKTRYIYFKPEKQGTRFQTNGYNRGVIVVMDENYRVIDELNGLPSKKYEEKNISPELHDCIYLDDGHYIIMDYITRNDDKVSKELDNTRLLTAYIQEVKNGEIVWEWMGTDYPQFIKGSVEGNDYTDGTKLSHDYMHINSMFIDPKDNNIICSLRNQDAIIKIDRNNGKVLWTLGGKNDEFKLKEKYYFERQHHATYTKEGKLILFDNGIKPRDSRVLEFDLDEKNKKIKSVKEYLIPGNHGDYTGSVQKIDEKNDVFLIGWGMSRTNNSMVTEVNFKDEKINTEIVAGGFLDTYRVLKFK